MASIAEFPWLAFIEGRGREGSFSCTGTVVAPRIVLTAGHCLEDLEAPSIRAASGYAVTTGVANHTSAMPADISPVSRLVVFPGLNVVSGHGDAGLLILAAPTAAPALTLASASDSDLLKAGTPLSITGWGLTRPGAAEIPAVLHTGATVVQAPSYCKRRSRGYEPFYSAPAQLCAVDAPGFQVGGCFGDSGGPAIAHRADGTPVEVGITSTGGPQCSRKLPNIFTRADRVSAWVRAWIAKTEHGGPAPKTPRATPPRLTVFKAEDLRDLVLAEDFRTRAPALVNHCVRIAKERVKCRASWSQGGNDYRGAVTTFYTVTRNTVVWKARYRVQWVSRGCRLHSDRPQTCPVHTRRR